MSTLVLTETQFEEQYRPILGEDGQWRMWHPQDPADLAFLRQQAPGTVWTVVYTDDACETPCDKCAWEADDNPDPGDPRGAALHVEPKMWLVDGLRYVNRDYCVVTQGSCPDDVMIEVPLDGI